MRILVTGGAGFIGSNFIRYILTKYPDCSVVNLDKLTYAGNLDNLRDVENDPRYTFIRGDICDSETVERAIRGCDALVNFAAESHVDRSIMNPGDFIQTDVYGVFTLLEAAKKFDVGRIVQVSTDEVYGSVESGSSKEEDPLAPRSPYSASKAGGEMMARAYFATYGLPVMITRGSNNIGPFQYPEKVVPLFITNAIDDQPLPIYGDGRAVRDYIYVLDHCEAIDLILREGTPGEVYNVGGGNQVNTVELATKILDLLGKPRDLMRFVADRPGHDRRYSLNSSKIKSLGWRPRFSFDEALRMTVNWYVGNESWWRKIKAKREDYIRYYQAQYGGRISVPSSGTD
ncbi:MAG: dTDP-glucose 4,6-dehydratase [bacterium]